MSKDGKKKSYQTIKSKNKELNKEIKLEREHPEDVLEDVIEHDEETPQPTIKDLEPKNIDKTSTKLLVITIIVIVAAIGLFFASKFVFKSIVEKEFYTYNGFSFSYDENENVWFTAFKMNDKIYPLPFHYSPRQLEHIPVEMDEADFLSHNFIYLVMPPMDTVEVGIGRKIGIAAVEVGKVIGTKNDIFNIPAKAAVSVVPNDLDNESVPVVTCADATNETAVLMFEFGSRTAVYEAKPNCYYLQGADGEEVVKAADRFVYEILGIMKSDYQVS